MTLSALIRKRETGNPATATAAISATRQREAKGSVARIATVAIATPPEARSASPAPMVGVDDRPITSCWWLVHYPDREPLQLACRPAASLAEILARQPDAIAAEPFEPIIRLPTSLLNADDEAAIRAWLAAIDETDPEIIADVLNQCRTDMDAQDYFVGRTRNSSSFKECAA